jgi:hypothetical protein
VGQHRGCTRNHRNGRSCPQSAVKNAIIDGLADVTALDRVISIEVSDRPGHPQHLVMGTCRQAKVGDRGPEEFGGCRLERAVFPDQPTAHSGIAARERTAVVR